MATNIEKSNQTWTKVGAITLSKLLYLETGLINNASPSVDVTLTGTSTLQTVPAGIAGYDISNFKFLLTGNNTVGALIASIGTNAPNFDNIMPAITFTGFNTIGDIWRQHLTGLVHRAIPTEVVTINITNAVAGAGAIISIFAIGEIVS